MRWLLKYGELYNVVCFHECSELSEVDNCLLIEKYPRSILLKNCTGRKPGVMIWVCAELAPFISQVQLDDPFGQVIGCHISAFQLSLLCVYGSRLKFEQDHIAQVLSQMTWQRRSILVGELNMILSQAGFYGLSSPPHWE